MSKSVNYEFYFKELENTYFELAFTELALDYYCFKERDLEKPVTEEYTQALGFRTGLEALVEKSFSDYASLEETGKKADALKTEIRDEVEKLVKIIDRLELDKYVSEREAKEGESFDYPDDDEAAKIVLRSIFAVNDNAIINERIKNAVYELPVRMTKVRFFDIIKNGMKLYIGSDCDILDRFVYMLESSTGISGDEVLKSMEEKPDLEKIRERYEYLNDLAGICNYICVIGGTDEKVRAEKKEDVEKLIELIKLSSSLNGDNAADAEKILGSLEGKLEDMSQKVPALEAKLAGYIESEEGELSEKAVMLERMRRLMSSSLYADLDTEVPEEADEKAVEQAFEGLKGKLETCFSADGRTLNRARMAAALSSLPVFFNSRTEVMNYVREALSSCSNNHEKNIAVSNILSSGSEDMEE
ncbi:MAG: hypothetical protein K6A45_09190 [Lachnospiraceae bacterium]|nr:hypothetical protein [Lachnospiraceae bacterium]